MPHVLVHHEDEYNNKNIDVCHSHRLEGYIMEQKPAFDWAKALGLAGSGCTSIGAALFIVGLMVCVLLTIIPLITH